MRRLIVLCLGLVALGILVAAFAPCALVPANVALKVGSRVIAAVIPTALAQEVLEFKPIPAESAAAIEARRARQRAARDAARARTQATVAPAPAVPAAPETAETPETPVRVEISRSGNIMRVGSEITIEADQRVVGDVLAVGGNVHVLGHVEGDVVSMGGDIHLESSARVDGDVVCMGGQLHEEEGAVVGGQRVTAAGGRDPLRRRIRDRIESHNREHIIGPLIWALITLGVAWAFSSIAPGRTAAAAEMVRREPGASTVVGFLALLLAGPMFLVIIILGALLCITIIGIPLALAAWAAYGLLTALVWIWGYVVGVAVLGQAVMARSTPRPSTDHSGLSPLVQQALIGVAIFSGAFVLSRILKVIPGLGGIGTLLAVLSWIGTGVFTMVGSGALIRSEWQSGTLLRRWRRQPAPVAGAAPAAQWYPASTAATPPPGAAPPPSGPAASPYEPPAGGTPPPVSG